MADFGPMVLRVMPRRARTGRRGGRLVGDVPGRAEGVPAAGRAAPTSRRGWSRSRTARPSTSPGRRRGGRVRGRVAARTAGPHRPRRRTGTATCGRRSPRCRPKQRAAVAYHYLAGLPYAQIAEIIGGSTDAARRAAADGIKTLRATYLARTRGARGPMMATTEPEAHRPPVRGAAGAGRAGDRAAARAAGRRGRAARASSTSPTGRWTRRSARCCWPRPSRGWSGWPTRTRATTPCCAQLAELVSPRILNAPGRLDAVARQLDEYFARPAPAFDLPLDLAAVEGLPPTAC